MIKKNENRDEVEKKWGSYNIQNDIRRVRTLKSSLIIKEFESMVKGNLIKKQKTQYRNIPSGF